MGQCIRPKLKRRLQNIVKRNIGLILLGTIACASLCFLDCTDCLGQESPSESNRTSQAELFHQLIRSRRSIRRYQPKPLPLEVLQRIVDDARFAPSARNVQSWRFIIVHKPELVQEMNGAVTWLPGFGPAKGEKPTAFIVVLGDKVNCAFAVENLVLSAHAEGIGSCIVGSVDWPRVKKLLKIPEKEQPFVVVTLGYPMEEAVSEDADREIGLRVWKDKAGKVHVPKKRLGEVMSVDGYAF